MKNGRRSMIKVCLFCQRVYLERHRCGEYGVIDSQAYYAWRIVLANAPYLVRAIALQLVGDVLERLRLKKGHDRLVWRQW